MGQKIKFEFVVLTNQKGFDPQTRYLKALVRFTSLSWQRRLVEAVRPARGREQRWQAGDEEMAPTAR